MVGGRGRGNPADTGGFACATRGRRTPTPAGGRGAAHPRRCVLIITQSGDPGGVRRRPAVDCALFACRPPPRSLPMLGPTKPRRLDEPIAVSLEDLVPRDHFYRHLEAKLDLGFVRDWTAELYAERGRPSIDPVVFFKLQLVMFFEGIRSERQLIDDGESQPSPPLVPRLHPRRTPPRPLQSDPHPATPWRRHLPALLREGR